MIVWGIDCGANRLSVAAIDSNARRLLTVRSAGPLPAAAPGEVLQALAQLSLEALSGLAGVYPPAVVSVEQPMGANRNPPLDHAAGVICAAAGLATKELGTIVRWENISTWRKTLGLKVGPSSSMSSYQRTKAWKHAALCAAAGAGYTGTDTDEGDAVCVALASINVAR